MSDIENALEQLVQYINEVQSSSENNKLTLSRVDFIQRELDKFNYGYNIASYYEKNVKYLFAPIELQALLYMVSGKELQAENMLREAKNYMLEGEEFISLAGREWEKDERLKKESDLKKPIEGFLTLYAIGFFLTPIILIYDIIQFFVSRSDLGVLLQYNSDIYDKLNAYMIAALIFDISSLIFLAIVAASFYNRLAITKILAILFHIYILIFGFALIIYLQDIYSQYNITNNGQFSGVLTLSAFIWPFYWVFSKRVKTTFTRPLKIGDTQIV